MTFVNPLDVIGIDSATIPDAETLKKARRRSLVELELAGDQLEIAGSTITRSDLMLAVKKLDDPEHIQFYHLLQQMPALSAFLSKGDLSYFRNGGNHEPPLDSSLIPLISPHFATSYGTALAKAVRESDAALVQTLTSRPPLISPSDLPAAERPLNQVLTQIRQDLESIREGLQAESVEPDEAVIKVRFMVSSDVLNSLPVRFETVRNQVARLLRQLGVIAFNVQDAVTPAFVLLSDASRLKTSPDVTDDIQTQLAAIREIREQKQMRERYADQLAECTGMLVALAEVAQDVTNEGVSPVNVVARAETIIRLELLNGLPDELTDVREQVAYALRGISVELWNTHNDAHAARAVLLTAMQLKLGPDARLLIEGDRATVEKLVHERATTIEKEKEDLRQLSKVITSMTDAVTQHHGDRVRWDYVADRLLELLSQNIIDWLKYMRARAPAQVAEVLQKLGPLLAGLYKYKSDGYTSVVQRLHPVVSGKPALENLVSRDTVRNLPNSDPSARMMTSSDSASAGWVWLVAIIGGIFLLGQCGA